MNEPIEYTVERLRKMATCVYAAADKQVAADLSGGFFWAIQKIADLENQLLLWRPLTPEEAQKAFDEAEAVPLSKEELGRIMKKAMDPAECLPNDQQSQLLVALKKSQAKAALFDEMRLVLLAVGMSAAIDARHFAERMRNNVAAQHNKERYCEMKKLVDRANKIAEVK